MEKPINDTDAFTLRRIASLPDETIFVYKDEDDKVFAFSAPDLYYQAQVNGPINPYTRKEIPPRDVERLQRQMRKLPKKDENWWTSPLDAFKFVLDTVETKYGIHAEASWMMNWTPREIRRIFYDFHISCDIPTVHMDTHLINKAYKNRHKDKHECQTLLAKEMFRLISDSSERFQKYFVCNLFFTFSIISKDFELNIPTWVKVHASCINL
jgi:hypothetical protein